MIYFRPRIFAEISARFTGYINFKRDEKSWEFCDPVRRLSLMQNCSRRVGSCAREEGTHLRFLMWINESLYDWTWTSICALRSCIGWTGCLSVERLCSTAEWQMLNVRVGCFKLCLTIRVKFMWINITGGHYIVVHRLAFSITSTAFIKVLSQIFLICSINPRC